MDLFIVMGTSGKDSQLLIRGSETVLNKKPNYL